MTVNGNYVSWYYSISELVELSSLLDNYSRENYKLEMIHSVGGEGVYYFFSHDQKLIYVFVPKNSDIHFVF